MIDAIPKQRRWYLVTVALCVVALIAILALTWWAYHPGLYGAFLFDDLGTLPKLGATGPVDNWPTFWRYITSGSADPTGRPIALLTFLIDGRNWPTHPYTFKVTNVILHLINGVLLAWVLWWLGRALLTARGFTSPRRQAPTPFVSKGVNGPVPKDVESSLAQDESAIPCASDAGAIPLPTGKGARRAGEGTHSPDAGDCDLIEPSPLPLSRRARGPTQVSGAVPLRAEGRNTRWPIFAALFGAGAWMLHPLFVSATLYIVQREAMLAATFVLIGTLGWIASRNALARGHIKRALVSMALSAWLCTGLAVLSKANGALFPLELLLVEWVVLSRQGMPDATARRWYRRAVAVFLILPSVLLIAYLLSMLPGLIRTTPDTRGWTVWQRFLTEPRVITDYLRLLFVPHARSTGLFNDAFRISANWLHPASTLPCAVLILALIGAGFALRKHHPAIGLALLFYFSAQLMESGWLPLELYFEHRNYLPAMLLFWPIGIGLARLRNVRWLGATAGILALLALAGLTRQRATLWGDAPHQAEVWAAINPDSARAQTSAALYDLQSGMPRLAAARLQLALPHHPDNLQVPVNLVVAECRLGTVQPAALAALRTALAHDRVGSAVAYRWFDATLSHIQRGTCSGVTLADMRVILAAAWRNPYWTLHRGLRANLYHMQGRLALAEAAPHKALQDFDRALQQDPEPGTALSQAATLASAGYPALGLAHLDYLQTLHAPPATGISMARIHAWVLYKEKWWPRQIAYLRGMLTAAATETRDTPN